MLRRPPYGRAPRRPRGPVPPAARGGGVYERVLRYPDGKERRIRYPVDDGGGGDGGGPAWAAASDAAWATPPRWPDGATAAAAAPATAPPPSTLDVPTSPAALARAAAAAGAAAAAADADADLAASFSVLDGCPWPLPRTLYLLAADAAGDDGGDDGEDGPPSTIVTLRVRRPRAAVASELSSLLGRPSSTFMDVAELVDGVLAFESEVAAAAFADALAAAPLARAASSPPASMAALSSHDLFRAAADARAVVVLVKEGAWGGVPDPAALAAALRSGKEL